MHRSIHIQFGIVRTPALSAVVDFQLMNLSDLYGKVSPCILRSRIFARLAPMRESVGSELTTVQNPYKYDYDKLICRDPDHQNQPATKF